MPPKKAKAAKGCAITLGANALPKDVLAGTTLANLKTSIANVDGTYTTKIEECTHLVLTQAQFNKPGKKVEDAKANPAVHIVSYEWLEKVLSSKSPVSEDEYLLYDRNQSTINDTTGNNGITSATTNGSKPAGSGNGITSDKNATKSKKRKRSDGDVEDDDAVPEIKRTVGNGKAMNVTKKLDMKIPLDDVLISLYGNIYKVHIDADSVIYDVTLNQSDSGQNANKFYRMQLLKDNHGGFSCWTRWGRVGEDGQNKMVVSGESYDRALAEFTKKFKDKTGNTWEERATGPMRAKKYVFIERSYEDSDQDSEGEDELPGAEKRAKKETVKREESEEDVVESKLPEPVQRLLKLIFNTDNFSAALASLDYDDKKMPLGKLSKSSLMRGYEVLKSLSNLVGSSAGSEDIKTLSNQYLSLIPHVVSRNSRPPVLDSMDMIKKELELLEALTDMQLANDMMKTAKKSKERAEEINLLDRQYEGLCMQEMNPIDPQPSEFKELRDYLVKSKGHTHGIQYKVQDIFRIERKGEHDRFDKSSYSKVSKKNRRLLWHGSRATNFGGILSQGLRIAPPEAPVSGYMFGKGVYLADMSSKSANYCCAYNTGGTALLLLCEAELGEPPLKLTDSDYNAGDRAKAADCLSTWGVGRTAPQAWKDASCVNPILKGVTMPDVVSKAPGDTGEQGAYLQYNEYIVYDVAQIKLRYLFRVQM